MPTLNLGKVRLSSEGEWTAGTDYEVLSLVTHQSEAFMCTVPVPTSTIPPPEVPDVWVKVGSKGDTGPKGDRGDTGLEGPMGSEGQRGFQGEAGPSGPQGEQGIPGEQGLKGDTGPAGPTGSKGDTGATGTQGPKGNPGTTGPAGLKGDTGAAGPQGPQGAQGAQGAKGNTGSTGAQGPQGSQGVTGPMPSLSSAVNSTSTTVAANSAAVKQAYDIAEKSKVILQPCINAHVYVAPMPCLAATLGQWVSLGTAMASQNIVLPAGGIWAYALNRWAITNSKMTGVVTGVASGGSTVISGSATFWYVGFCWRVY